MHYDGSSWSEVPKPAAFPDFANGVWSSSRSNVWVVGGCCTGTIVHYDGSTWSNVGPGAPYVFTSIWGSSARDVWVVGDIGEMLHGVPR
jgi:hypothetical protein